MPAPSLVEYKGEEAFTTRVKVVDFSKARRDLKHDPKIDIREGVQRYVAWARKVYEARIKEHKHGSIPKAL